MLDEPLADEELVFRRIPPTAPWFEPPDRISSINFKLRSGERGLSVYRQRIVTPEQVLKHPEAIPDSRLVYATVGEIRGLTNVKGEPLDLDVFAADDGNNPGHAEIRAGRGGKFTASVANVLRRFFRPWSE